MRTNSPLRSSFSLPLRTAVWLLLGSLLLSSCSSIISASRQDAIEENYNKRTTGAYIDDKFIATKAKVNIDKSDPQLKKAQVQVDSFNGVVLLTGNVPSSAMRDLATETVQKIRKVRRVHNELEIGPPRSAGATLGDTWLSSKVKSRLLFDKRVNSRRIHVVTENGVIYLRGLVTHDEANTAVAVTKKAYGLQKIVRVFEYID